MVSCFDANSVKQIIGNKPVRFGYKNFLLACSDGYPLYPGILYAGAKGIGETPGKDFTLRAVTELVLKSYEELGNLTFDKRY